MSPMRPGWLRLRWLFNRRMAKALLWTVAIVAAAVGANNADKLSVRNGKVKMAEKTVFIHAARRVDLADIPELKH